MNRYTYACKQIHEYQDTTIHKVGATVTYDDLDVDVDVDVSLARAGQVAIVGSGRAHSIDDVVAMSSPAPNPNCPYVLPSSSAQLASQLAEADATHIERQIIIDFLTLDIFQATE